MPMKKNSNNFVYYYYLIKMIDLKEILKEYSKKKKKFLFSYFLNQFVIIVQDVERIHVNEHSNH
jgi:hypothetical protein